MPIYDQSYRHWQGRFRPLRLRWLPMVRYHIDLLLKKRMVWLLIFGSFVAPIGLSVFIYVVSNEGSGLPGGLTMVLEENFADFIAVDRGTPRRPPSSPVAVPPQDVPPMTTDEVYWLAARYGFQFFVIQIQSFIVMIIVSVVGAGLIAHDIRSNALEIYLTKPISGLDYVLGKLAVIAFFVFVVLFVPGLVVFLVATSLWPGFFSAAWPILPRYVAFCLIASAINGLVILGLSSLAKSSRYASGIWFALCFVTAIVGNILFFTTGVGAFELISYRESFRGVAEAIFATRPWHDAFAQGQVLEFSPAPKWLPFAILGGWVALSSCLLRRAVCNLENR